MNVVCGFACLQLELLTSQLLQMARAAERSIYDCSICLGLPDGHVIQCRSGHLFCEDCLQAHRSSGSSHASKCPVCRVGLGSAALAIRCLAAEQAIAAMQTSCQHCSASMSRGELRDHYPLAQGDLSNALQKHARRRYRGVSCRRTSSRVRTLYAPPRRVACRRRWRSSLLRYGRQRTQR